MKALIMEHQADPKQAIWDEVNEHLGDLEPLADEVLCAIYVRPNKTKGGIITTFTQAEEDVWQGKVGLVLKKGPLAFTEDADHHWGGKVPEIGDWVVWRIGDTFQCIMGKRHVKFVKDGNIKAILKNPDIIW